MKPTRKALEAGLASHQKTIASLTSANDELRDRLHELLRDDLFRQYHASREFSYGRRPMEWVMHPKWHSLVLGLPDYAGRPFTDFASSAEDRCLLGSPIRVDASAKSPELRHVKS